MGLGIRRLSASRVGSLTSSRPKFPNRPKVTREVPWSAPPIQKTPGMPSRLPDLRCLHCTEGFLGSSHNRRFIVVFCRVSYSDLLFQSIRRCSEIKFMELPDERRHHPPRLSWNFNSFVAVFQFSGSCFAVSPFKKGSVSGDGQAWANWFSQPTALFLKGKPKLLKEWRSQA